LPTRHYCQYPLAAWQSVTWRLVKGFVKWLLNQGYGLASVNNRLPACCWIWGCEPVMYLFFCRIVAVNVVGVDEDVVHINGRRHRFPVHYFQSQLHQLFPVSFGHVGGGADQARLGIANLAPD
jgi:hypothetical protein